MNWFPYHHARAYCPPVLRAVAQGNGRAPTTQRTLLRQPGERADAFAERAQREAFSLWLQEGMRRAVFVECFYEVPADPHFFDDERANDLHVLRRVACDTSDEPEVRVAAMKAMNRILGIVPAEVW